MKIQLSFLIVLFAFSLSSQARINGVVTDKSGEALIGASVLLVGTTNGTVTDIDGRFSLEVDSDAIRLRVDYTGGRWDFT